MKKLLKSALLPALTILLEQASNSTSASNGGAVGIDLSTGSPFAGWQGRLSDPDVPAQLALSVEDALSGDAGRWQVNADVLQSFEAGSDAFVPYAGLGLCYVDAPETSSSGGVNLIGGANVDLGPIEAYVQVRLTVADGIHLSLVLGAFPS